MTTCNKRTAAYPRKISQNQFYQLFHVGKWRCTIAIPNVGTAGIQHSPHRNPRVDDILTHSKQDAVEMISKLDRLNIKNREATLRGVSKSYKISHSGSHRHHNKHTSNTWKKLSPNIHLLT